MTTLTTMNQKDFDVLENSLKVLSENMTSVATDVVDINGQISGFHNQVESIQSNVKTLEEEIKRLMGEIKGSTSVSNAQNDILLNENKLNKKYGHYDEIRRKITGILSSIDINSINKKTLLTQSEQSILSTPDYYLSYALVALCCWFRNEKKSAYKALNNALKLNESKTSLLFCLIHLRLNRHQTALKWLKKYLEVQNPNNMDALIINVLDSLANNAYDMKMTEEILLSVDSWVTALKNNDNIKRLQINRWDKFFLNASEEIKDNEYPFASAHCDNFNEIKNKLSNSYAYYNVYYDLIDRVEDVKDNKIKNSNDLLNDILNSYESKELSIRKDMLKSELIIQNKGDVDAANEKYKDSELSLSEKIDFNTELTNIILERNDVSINTKKLAMSYSKDMIKSALDETYPLYSEIGDTIIKLDEWTGTTKDGSNEKELLESLSNYIKKPFTLESDKYKLFNAKTIYCAVFALAGIVTLFFDIIIGIAILIIAGLAFLFFTQETKAEKQKIFNQYIELFNKFKFELNNTLAEIVDMNFIIKRNNKDREHVIDYINSFDKNNYITDKRL